MNEQLISLFNTSIPIIQAPMAGVQDHSLAVSISNAGGLGSLPCATLSLDMLRSELLAIKTKTSRPINLNFFCHTPLKFDAERELRWRTELQPYFSNYHIDPNDILNTQGFSPFNHATVDLLEKFKPKLISFHFGLPRADLLARVKSWGTRILSTANTVEEAQWLESKSVDGIIAQGLEAGGHRGMFLSDKLTDQLPTFELLEKIIPRISTPIIAAGGIANTNDISKALSLGAIAVQMGTTFLLCHETKTSPLHRHSIKYNAIANTTITNVFTGRPARSIINKIVAEIGPINSNVPAFPLAISALTPLRMYAEKNGLDDFTPLWCGQNTSNCQNISAAELITQLAKKLSC